MDIIIIRHTQVDIEQGTCYGQSDVKLASDFEMEIEAIATKIKDLEYDIVYSSPLQRCLFLSQTLFPNKKIIIDERLKEMNFGNWEMMNWDDIFKTIEGKAFFDNYFETACPDGESYTDLIHRIREFYEEIKNKYSGKKLVIVTHSGPIRAFIQIIEGITQKEVFERKLDFGEVLKFEV
jgi:alpha-ribazole phosphatase